MSVSPINVSRITHTFRTSFVTDSTTRTQRALFLSQARIASGRAFVTPSENPIAASRALNLTQALQRQDQFVSNLQQGSNFLAAADGAFSEINDLLIEASVIASQTVSNLTAAAEREAEAEVVRSIRQQLTSVANRDFNGRHLFAGRDTIDRPFIDALGGIAYVGDLQGLFVRADETLISPISVPGSMLFGALSDPISTDANLTPILTADTRLDAVSTRSGRPLETGVLVFNEIGGAGVFSADLTSADTIEDIVTLINDAATAAGAALVASSDDNGLIVTPGGSEVTITDSGSGATAAGLGLLTQTSTSSVIVGSTLTARVTRLTPIEDLASGDGIDLDSGFIITNGGRVATIDISEAKTVQNVINAINGADVFVLARINDEGTGIDVFNQVSGTSLTVGENGGTTATDLGLRTLDTATPLARLNFGLGVSVETGKDDFQITAKDGSTIDVNIDGAETIGDVIDLINEAATDASVSIAAEFAETGNGIRLLDTSGGTGDLSVRILNLSKAALDLGLVKTVTGTATELVSDDVNPTRTEGVLGALIDLENALRSNDTRGISLAGERIDSLTGEVTRIHGIVGARAQSMGRTVAQTEDAATTTRLVLSGLQDLDFTGAITELQGLTTQLQASFQTSSILLNLNLMDFLR